MTFTPCPGCLLVAAEDVNKVYGISPSGSITSIANWPAAEGVHFVPAGKCSFGNQRGTFFTVILSAPPALSSIYQFPLATIEGQGGNAIVTSESNRGMGLLTPGGISLFHPGIGPHEGSAFVDCGVPTLLKIDVKPGSDPDTINPATEPLVPVAILSSPSFNAAVQPIVSTIRFGRTGTENSIQSCAAQDVDGDGRPDLLCQAVTARLGIPASGAFDGPLFLKTHYRAAFGDPAAEGGD
jgi:hypothetical protein